MTDPRETTRPPDPPPPWEEWGFEPPRNPNALPPGRGLPDLSPLLALLEALRRMVPAELQHQFGALQRELLLTLRALIDWYLERLDAPKGEMRVEDIPIE